MSPQNLPPIRVIFLDPTASRQVEAEVADILVAEEELVVC